MIGNAPTSAMTFTIGPPPPTIVAHPTDPSSSTSASFAFADTKSGVRFECRLDGGAWTACANPAVYGPLGVGEHNFSVRAVDPQGNASAVTPFAFTIAQAQNEPFTITGNIATPLYPGAGAVAIPTTLTNPNPVPIYVTAVTAAIAGNALPAGCSTSWFEIVQSSVSTTNPVQVPANGSVSLPAQGASAASIQMANPNTNQDACQGAQLAISYSGSAY
jgi:hypothetical protein